MVKKVLLAAAVLFVLATGGLYFWARSILTQDNLRTALAAKMADALGQPVTIGGLGATLMPRLSLELHDVAIGQPARIRLRQVLVGTDFRALLSRRIEHAAAHIDGADLELPLPTFGQPSAAAAPPASPSGATPNGAASAAAPASPAGLSAPPLDIVSIDEVIVTDIKLTSSGRVLRGRLELVPTTTTDVTIRALSLAAEDTSIEATGHITDITGPVGELTITAGDLNVDRLMDFLQDFSAGATAADATRAPVSPPDQRALTNGVTDRGGAVDLNERPLAAGTTDAAADVARVALVQDRPGGAPSGVQLTVNVTAKKAISNGVALEGLSARALVRDQQVTVDPVSFGVFGGHYDGRAVVGTPPAGDMNFAFTGKLTGVDMHAINAFTHSADTLTGTLRGALDLRATGADAGAAMRRARGTLRAEIADGVVKNLGLVRAIVTATSGRTDSGGAASGLAALTQLTGPATGARPLPPMPPSSEPAAAAPSRDEPFTTLGATLAIADMVATTNDLRFESPNLAMTGGGTLRLDGSAIDLRTQVQLSEALTKQAGRDLVRYTQQNGRVTVPATITGSSINPVVRIDIGSLASRAAQNAANEQIEKGKKQLENELKKGLGGLFGKKPK